jgi:transposase-like protein
LSSTARDNIHGKFGRKFGGRPRGAWSKVSPQARQAIIRFLIDGVPVSTIARKFKISRQYVYVLWRRELGLIEYETGGGGNEKEQGQEFAPVLGAKTGVTKEKV